jgi:hypothetical protein
MFSKKLLGIPICFSGYSTISGVRNNSKYFRRLLGSSKSTFRPGLPVNGNHDCSAPDFAHVSCCMLLLLPTFFFFRADSQITTWHDFHIHFAITTIFTAGHSGCVVWGMKCLCPLKCWDHGIESHSRQSKAYVYSVLALSSVGSSLALGWSPVQGVLPTV